MTLLPAGLVETTATKKLHEITGWISAIEVLLHMEYELLASFLMFIFNEFKFNQNNYQVSTRNNYLQNCNNWWYFVTYDHENKNKSNKKGPFYASGILGKLSTHSNRTLIFFLLIWNASVLFWQMRFNHSDIPSKSKFEIILIYFCSVWVSVSVRCTGTEINNKKFKC